MAADGMMAKYFNQDERHLYDFDFSGRSQDGFPVRGNAAMLKQEEHDDMPITCNFHAKWFRLWIEDDHKAFVEVMDHVANGAFYVQHRRDVEVPRSGEDGNDLKVWLEWLVLYKLPPRGHTQAPGFPQAPSANIPLGG